VSVHKKKKKKQSLLVRINRFIFCAGETSEVDHLVFVVHGIGSVCDIKFRTIAEVVDGFRELAEDMSQKHFQSAHLSGL
jgi:hypothetical protein